MTTLTANVISLATKTGGKHLGDIVFPRFRNATVSHTALEALADKYKFPKDLLPPGLEPEQAWQYAMRRTKDLGSYILRNIKKDDKEIVWGLVHEQKDPGTDSLRYQQVCTLTLLRGTGYASSSDMAHPIVIATMRYFSQLCGSVTTDDIRKMVVDVCRKNQGIPVGTAWFVPSLHSELIRGMKSVVESLGESEAWLLPIYDSAESREGLSQATRADLQDEINTIKSEIESFSTESTQLGTMERRLARFDELRGKAKLYTAILSIAHQDLLDEVEKLEKTVSEMIGLKKTCPTQR